MYIIDQFLQKLLKNKDSSRPPDDHDLADCRPPARAMSDHHVATGRPAGDMTLIWRTTARQEQNLMVTWRPSARQMTLIWRPDARQMTLIWT